MIILSLTLKKEEMLAKIVEQFNVEITEKSGIKTYFKSDNEVEDALKIKNLIKKELGHAVFFNVEVK